MKISKKFSVEKEDILIPKLGYTQNSDPETPLNEKQ